MHRENETDTSKILIIVFSDSLPKATNGTLEADGAASGWVLDGNRRMRELQ